MNKETKDFVINQITFTLKIFCIIFGITILSGGVCYLTDIDGVKGYKAIIISGLFACFYGVYATIRRMKLP